MSIAVHAPIANRKPGPLFPEVSLHRSGSPNLTALVVCPGKYQLIPVKRLARTLSGLFGVKPSEGTIVDMASRKAGGFRELDEHVRKALVRAQVVHMDETGIRVGGRLHWLHVACTCFLTHFRIGRGRDDIMLEALGIVVHDCWKSCFGMPHVAGHGICCVNILRELENLFQFGREKWAGDLAGLPDGAPLSPEAMGEIGDSYDRIAGEGLGYHASLKPLSSPGRRGRRRRRKGYNPLLRLRDHRDAVLLFTRNPPVPATNNIAELDLGMEKVRQRISGCHRSMEEAINRTIIRTVPATARKQGWNMLDTLRKSPPELKASLVVDILVQASG
ncbi:MAG: transposase [Rhodobacteraceae bacterium]|nr:transposase [Paracoccaceae bacterium]MCY4251183.1 transposase [Paracoccaceae bacterium]